MTSIHSTGDRAAFGTQAPHGVARLLIAASRKTVLGHGEPRKLIWRVIRSMSQSQFDVQVGDVLMRLSPFESSLEQGLLLRPSRYCPGELAFLAKALAGGGTLIDAGANVGALSLPFARLPRVRIIAVEPIPGILERLAFNIAANGYRNVAVEAAALSDFDGKVSIFADARDAKLSGIGKSGGQGAEIEVKAKTFSTLLRDHEVHPPYVLKIDVEGHEDVVLMPFFRSAPVALWPGHVLIETIERQGVPECVSFMLANGYRRSFKSPQNTGLTLDAAA